MLATIGLSWIVCGIIAFVGLHVGWRLIPSIVFAGIGVLFLRGAAVGAQRQGALGDGPGR